MNKLQLIEQENNLVRIKKAGNGYVGIIYHPETHREVERVYSNTERGVRAKIVRYVYTTLPVNSDE